MSTSRPPAVFSPDRVHRYALWRHWLVGEGQLLTIMLNPSTADEHLNDPTIRRVLDFAADSGYRSLAVANLFALRSTDPKGLLDHNDPVGPANQRWIETLIEESDSVLVAWGAFPFAAERAEEVLQLLETTDIPVFCLGKTAGGDPRHPLYVKRRPGLIPFERENPRKESHV